MSVIFTQNLEILDTSGGDAHFDFSITGACLLQTANNQSFTVEGTGTGEVRLKSGTGNVVLESNSADRITIGSANITLNSDAAGTVDIQRAGTSFLAGSSAGALTLQSTVAGQNTILQSSGAGNTTVTGGTNVVVNAGLGTMELQEGGTARFTIDTGAITLNPTAALTFNQGGNARIVVDSNGAIDLTSASSQDITLTPGTGGSSVINGLSLNQLKSETLAVDHDGDTNSSSLTSFTASTGTIIVMVDAATAGVTHAIFMLCKAVQANAGTTNRLCSSAGSNSEQLTMDWDSGANGPALSFDADYTGSLGVGTTDFNITVLIASV